MIASRHERSRAKPKLLSTVVVAALGLTLGSATTAAELKVSDTQPKAVGQAFVPERAKQSRVTATGEKATYIVQMKQPAVASYKGGIAKLAATNPKMTGVKRLDVNTKASLDYAGFLKGKQKELIAHCEQAFGRDLAVKYTYQHAFNGVAMELSESEAKAIRFLPEVAKVERERVEYMNTDAGPAWIGAPAIWDGGGMYGGMGTMGEGAVIAILDSGINHDHPSFADIGGDGYDHTNPLGSGNYIPGSYCDTVDPTFCNDKLIGAWDMVQSSADPGAPEDSDGHGSHTASTAAGNFIMPATLAAPTTSLVRDISGVAPHANIIAYDVCIDSCPGSALMAALEQVVIDASALPNGIHALNYSISGGNDPYNDSIELAFLNATEAGIYVAVSAGNEGPGPATTGHNSPWVSATAAMTHNRATPNAVVNMSSDGAPQGDLYGAGLTAGYGPAPIVFAGDFPTSNGSSNDTDPAQCLDPFPPGHFNGEIVICDRGAIARVEKGANVLAGGAGGFVLANAAANGESVVGDPHFLPGVHLGFTDGQTLKDWVAANTGTMGSIQGFVLDLDPSNGDIMAGFSSRGPNSSINVLKPDVGGPGVDVMAAVNTVDPSDPPEFDFLSGTSMSSPHNAGAGALLNLLTDWTPYEIKSALMMTSKKDGMFKEDGVTPTDPFDVGAGRIQVDRALTASLVLNETGANFLAADPALGGDPKTLNIASMADNNCVGSCSWTRSVTNTTDRHGWWFLRARSGDLDLSVSPWAISLAPGESADVTVTADTTLQAEDWGFGHLYLEPLGRGATKLHMPVAAYGAKSTYAGLSKTVDKASASGGEILNYEVKIENGPLTDVIDITDMLPYGVSYVEGSASTSIMNGSEVSPVSASGGQINWSVLLDAGGLDVAEQEAPFGYVSLASLGVAPFDFPSSTDEGAWLLNVDPFDYNGETYNQVIWSVNGTVEVGSASGSAINFINLFMPDPSSPNNLLAPFWTDLDFTAQGSWYVADLTAGSDSFLVFEWENVPLWNFGQPGPGYTFQIWIQKGTDNIWFTYDAIPEVPFFLTVGAENADGDIGDSYYFDGSGTPPAVGTDLTVETTLGGSATLNFQGEMGRFACYSYKHQVKTNTVYLNSGEVSERAIAATQCIR